MIIVIAVLGIAGAMVIPSMGQTGVLRVQAAVRTIVADITYAQSDAVAFQQRRCVLFDVATSSYRLVSVPGDTIDPDINTLYDPTSRTGLYEVSFEDNKFGDARITEVNFDDDSALVFDAMGGPLFDLNGNLPSQQVGTITVTGSGSVFRISVEPFTGRVTVTRVSGP
ncbi:MAG: hypothetical protein H7Y88_04650 [Phycisphaerales bacterium]|nr:hypothetical protein [Phycisphaerales bacterium]